MDQTPYPIRINRYLALHGIATRRNADELISKKRVTINGRIAILGEMVQKEDHVEIKKSAGKPTQYLYIAYHKPIGVITHSAQKGEKDIAQILDRAYADLFPVGRLDKDSSGLLILTNDGRITDRLLNPKYEHEKEYIVDVDKKITPHDLRMLERGVDIEGYHTKPSRTQFIAERKLRITLFEGKKHQIRRMLAAIGMQVRSLKRVRIMNIELGKLKEGQMRKLTGDELTHFLSALGLV